MRAALMVSLIMTRARVGGWTVLSRSGAISATLRASPRRLPHRPIHLSAPSPYISRAGDQISSSEPTLRLLNSLTQSSDPFVPIDPRLVKWYICGPTVYDSAHVGHARNYVAFDIVRRVLIYYFGYDLLYVMNITDIDDKIILRTHRNHLEASIEQITRAPSSDAMLSAMQAARKVLGEAKPTLTQFMQAQAGLCEAASKSGIDGISACDVQSAFLELTARFEREFFKDMKALNVLPPDAITRVSDYVPEIVAYIEQIASNGYCYEANGSVYFDTSAFRASGKPYGKLDPTKVPPNA